MTHQSIAEEPCQTPYPQVHSNQQVVSVLSRCQFQEMCLTGEICVNEKLQTLITQLQRSEAGALQRRRLFNQLVFLLQRRPDLYRVSHPDYPEAQNRTWEWVYKNIDSFDPQYMDNPGDSASFAERFLKWVNGYLYWRVRDLFSPDSKYERSLSDPIGHADQQESGTLGDMIFDPKTRSGLIHYLIEQIDQQDRENLGKAIQNYIERDPEQKLKQCCLRKCPQCHGQLLAIRILMWQPPQRIRDIAKEFKVSEQTLHSHWKRRCLPLLREIAEGI